MFAYVSLMIYFLIFTFKATKDGEVIPLAWVDPIHWCQMCCQTHGNYYIIKWLWTLCSWNILCSKKI